MCKFMRDYFYPPAKEPIGVALRREETLLFGAVGVFLLFLIGIGYIWSRFL
jgi:hypothetical protein